MVDIGGLSQAYAEPDIAAKQRVIVDRQLQEMHAGNAPAHFAVVGEIIAGLRRWEETGSVVLLDAGCSSAYYHEIIEYYVPGWVQYVGADYNLGMVDMAKVYYPDLPVVQADMQHLEFEDRAFDIVLTGGTLVHIKDWQQALRELVRVTRRWLLLHRTWVYFDEPTLQRTSQAYGHEVWDHYLNEQELISLIENGGFQLIKNCNAGEGPPDGSTKKWGVRTHLFERQ